MQHETCSQPMLWGFGLSLEAQEAYLARQGRQAFFYERDPLVKYPQRGDFVRVTPPGRSTMVHTRTQDLGDRVPYDEFYGTGDPSSPEGYFYARDLKRDDPDLVAVVEELGARANGDHAKLAVVEIPDDIQYTIEDYDGIESIHEVHRSWG